MDCPFDLYMPDNEEDDNPHLDKDEEQMNEKKQSEIKPIEDFLVTKKPPHQSEFDEEIKKQRALDEEEMK